MKKSIWSEFTEKPQFESLKQDIECDVLVIGGGIAGILTAYELQKRGRDVVLTEAREIGGGITKNTTAVLTAQHDTPYSVLIQKNGLKKAKAYLDANLQAVEEFKRLAKTIDCDFKREPSYLFSVNQDLSWERDALETLGFEAQLTRQTDLPFEICSAIKFPNMASFHPLKFLYALAAPLHIYEHTFVRNIKNQTAFTDSYRIRFQQAVVATHFPFMDRAGLFFLRMYQMRSYVLALEHAGNVSGTYTDLAESGYYFRNYGELLLVGKGDHRTATQTHAVDELKAFAKKYYPDAKIKSIWANQDCVTLDDLPYVGRYGRLKNIYTATGFNLWGMTNAMAASKILADQMNGTENEYAFAFDSTRSIFHRQLFANLGVFLREILWPTVKRCPHLGCALKYNPREHSWDCPCHGSRFTEHGRLIDNPSDRDANV